MGEVRFKFPKDQQAVRFPYHHLVLSVALSITFSLSITGPFLISLSLSRTQMFSDLLPSQEHLHTLAQS